MEDFPFSLELIKYNIWFLDEEPFQMFYYSHLVLLWCLDNLSFSSTVAVGEVEVGGGDSFDLFILLCSSYLFSNVLNHFFF